MAEIASQPEVWATAAALAAPRAPLLGRPRGAGAA